VAQPSRKLVFDQVGSTNREAFALAACGQTGPLWIVARRQTAGRGRSGRPWASMPGNLHASLLIELACAPAVAPQLSLLAGVATVDAIRLAADGGPAGLRLKWPNDVLIGEAKCAGMLVGTSNSPRPRPDSPPPCGEGLGVGQGTVWHTSAHKSKQLHSVTAVIGIGINLAWHPADLGRSATHLGLHGAQVSPEAMLDRLDAAMQRWLGTWDRGAEFASVRQAWLERAGPAGEAVSVDTGSERIAGAFVELDANGGLVLRDGRGRYRTVTFGDVALTSAAPQKAG
jgi:BirA family biotin operon repressor/biotin-[acetyl-CoA-carboxylase] ligase